MPKVTKVGIELEGGWDYTPPGVGFGAIRFRADGSVRSGGDVHGGELASPPIDPGDLPDWVRDHYPTRIGPSCGLHVHMSFGPNRAINAAAVSALATDGYADSLLSALRAWGDDYPCRRRSFWDRLDGHNDFCSLGHNGRVLDRESASRYRQVNFAAWERHRTIEVRVLPMFRSRAVAISALQCIIGHTDTYLVEYYSGVDVECQVLAENHLPPLLETM